MTMKTKEQIIAERQEVVRRMMLSEIDGSNLFGLMATADYEGRAMVTRWYLFGQVALYDNGSLLYNDDNWAEIRQELSIPASFWMAALLKPRAINDLGSIITDVGGYQFPLTDLGRDNDNPRIYRTTWWDNRIRNVRRSQVLAWLGITGGTLPGVA